MGAGALNNVDLESLEKRRTKNEQWVGLQWVYSGSTVALQRTKDEQKTNKRRRKSEGKLKLR